ncbi:hypothetical protein AAZX31_06G231600 [Glycine max]
MVPLPPLTKSYMDVNACNTKLGSRKCRPMETQVAQPRPKAPQVAPTCPTLDCIGESENEEVAGEESPIHIQLPQNPFLKIQPHACSTLNVVLCLVYELFDLLVFLIRRPNDIIQCN